jgi:hypothetical protein
MMGDSTSPVDAASRGSPMAFVRASESGYDAPTCCGDARRDIEDGGIVADASGGITSWGTTLTFLKVGT